MKKPRELHNFYKSKNWKLAREIKILDQNGLCERCGKPGVEVHHKIRLTIDNVENTQISVKQDNLELLCRECHNKEHMRFSSKQKFDDQGNLINID